MNSSCTEMPLLLNLTKNGATIALGKARTSIVIMPPQLNPATIPWATGLKATSLSPVHILDHPNLSPCQSPAHCTIPFFYQHYQSFNNRAHSTRARCAPPASQSVRGSKSTENEAERGACRATNPPPPPAHASPLSFLWISGVVQ